jgi:multidrug transporter EmrE-like cation transporter
MSWLYLLIAGPRLACIGLILAGIVGLKFASAH